MAAAKATVATAAARQGGSSGMAARHPLAGHALLSHEICSARVIASSSASSRAADGSVKLNHGKTGAGGGAVSTPLSQPGELTFCQPPDLR